MFGDEEIASDEDQIINYSSKNINASQILEPFPESDFNHLTGENESLVRLMKQRGFQVSEAETKKGKPKKKQTQQPAKTKPRAGYFDGGHAASLEDLLKALNKALTNADPQQASCVLGHILDKKLEPADRSKFGLMKCNILFGLGAYKDCISKAQELLQTCVDIDAMTKASLSNYLAKSKGESGQILSGYIDYLRAKAIVDEEKKIAKQQQSMQTTDNNQFDYSDSELDTLSRELDHTEVEYNIKMTPYKNTTNLVYPYFPELRHRKVLEVVCGDYHTILLVAGSLSRSENKDIEQTKWSTELFGLGENNVGQITGKPTKQIIKEPILLSELSGKGIQGICACKESSAAYDKQGNIYEWGVTLNATSQVSHLCTVGEEIQRLQKGYHHYALLTRSGKFYTWGSIEHKGVSIYKQAKPHLQQSQKIVDFSCGNHCIIALDADGSAYACGSNHVGQLALPGENHSKAFKKITNGMLSNLRKVVCLNDCSFFISEDEEMFFCGRYSYEKQELQKPRQAEFANDLQSIVSVSGTIGSYYATDQTGNLYHWDVDSSVRFKLNRDQNFCQRVVSAHRGAPFRVKSLVEPEMCTLNQKTTAPMSYEPIEFQLELRDRHGLYGNQDLILPLKYFVCNLRCQIFLSTYSIQKADLLKENDLFLDSYEFSQNNKKVLLNEIVEARMVNYTATRSTEKPWLVNISINADAAGKYYFYMVVENSMIYGKELLIEVSEREKELGEKSKGDKTAKDEERKKKAEIERQRLLEEKRRKEAEEEERRKETQKRAEEAFKRHMRDQEEAKNKTEEERKMRKQLQTGGGFDLHKMKALNELKMESKVLKKQTRDTRQTQEVKIEEYNSEMGKSTDSFMKSSDSFLPDINRRPSSKRKLNLPNPSQIAQFKDRPASKVGATITSNFPMQGTKSKTNSMMKTVTNNNPMNPMQALNNMNSTKTGNSTQLKATTIKRGFSKSRK